MSPQGSAVGDRVRRADNGRFLTLGEALGRGGQARVFEIVGEPRLAAKVFGDDGRPGYLEATKRLLDTTRPDVRCPELRATAGHTFLTWPITLVERAGEPVGYLMPRLPADHVKLMSLFSRDGLLGHAPEADWTYLLHVAAGLARLVSLVHDARFVVCDLAPKNVMVAPNGQVSLIDCDSFQVQGGTGDLATVDYMAPERMTGPGGPVTTAMDDFSLAILICELLARGSHPFDGVPVDMTLEEISPSHLIRGHRSRFVDPAKVNLPPRTLPLDIFPPGILLLARTAFGPGHADPGRRPLAGIWAARLRSALDGVVACPAEPRHTYSPSGTAGCPWCRHVAKGYRDPFVSGERRQSAPGLARPAARMAPQPAPSHTARAFGIALGILLLAGLIVFAVLSLGH